MRLSTTLCVVCLAAAGCGGASSHPGDAAQVADAPAANPDSGGVGAPDAGTNDPIARPGRTDMIEKVDSMTATVGGVTWIADYYRNNAYPCSLKGHQTFVVMYRAGVPTTQSQPLYVKLHGGGAGWFDSTGTPQPNSGLMQEQPFSGLLKVLSTSTGLTPKVRKDPAGFRFLAPSMCDRDLYAGGDTPDPNNPTGATTNGFYATKAAVQYTRAHYATGKSIVFGESAGGWGAFLVSYGLQRQGIAPAGTIADSGVPNTKFRAAVVASINSTGKPVACASEVDLLAEEVAAVPKRIMPAWTDPANAFDKLIADGKFTVPVMLVWNEGDPASCRGVTAANQFACPLPNGTTVTLGGADCNRRPIADAIKAAGDPRSKILRLCVTVTNPGGLTCNHHIVTGIDGTNSDTAGGMPADYNTAVANWIDARLNDPSP